MSLKAKAIELMESARSGTATVEFLDALGCQASLSTAEIIEWCRITASLPKVSELDACVADEESDLESRTSSFGMLRYAHQYQKAALLVHDAKADGEHFAPAHMLIGQSIELSLKAFLRARGMKLPELKALGHNLERTLDCARAYKLRRVVNLGDDLENCIRDFSSPYADGGFRYIRNGTVTVPSWFLLSAIAVELKSRLRLYCLRHTVGRETARVVVANRGDRF